MEEYESSYTKKNHFSFGKNWSKFLKSLNDEKIDEAKKSLVDYLGGEDNVRGKTFVDIGCGSGLFSLAAVLLGASRVVSVDIDDFSLECVKFLKEKQGNPKIGGLRGDPLSTRALSRNLEHSTWSIRGGCFTIRVICGGRLKMFFQS